ncbi:MAG TPA: terminase family protein [Xanthobacteraceae bacterium]|jgi:phage terminase large subunit-like protein
MHYPPTDQNAREMFGRLADALDGDWRSIARPNQLPPEWAWRIWLLLAGRGFGKTRAGAEWVCARAATGSARRIALVAATAADVRDVVVEGESGILAVSPRWCRPVYEPSRRRISWPNGCIATTFSADEPERLRGPQFDCAWCDEIGAWRYSEAWDMLMLGLRLGTNPQCVVTSTPRPIKLIRDLLAREGKDVAVSRGTTYENAANLADAFLAQIVRRYEGTRLGRQELNAELLDDVPGALWDRDRIEASRVERPPALRRIVVAIDPAVTSGEDADETGIVVAGMGADGHGYVLEDLSGRYAPIEWARIAVAAYRRHRADRIIAETNNGGEMVEATVRMVDPNVAFKAVHASRGKFTRAEPVSALYEQGRVHHVGGLSCLEDQMCSFTPDLDRDRAKSSPDRVDALVWAFTELMVEGTAQAWIDHYGAMAAAANVPAASPVAGDALPWRPKPAPSRPVVDNELVDLYRETFESARANRNLRCRDCGKPMTPGETRITDGIEMWHPTCSQVC